MKDIVNVETIPTAIIGNLSRKEIKDKAADMVVGLDSEDIKSYNPESSRKNRILNRVYNRYNKKYNDEKFANLSLKEINKLSPKEQERWFALNKSKTAGPILGGMLAVTSIPMTLGGLVTTGSTVPTLFSLAGGFGGSYVGSKIGEEYDKNRHGLSNNALAGSLVGGTLGSISGVGTHLLASKYIPVYNAYVDSPKLMLKGRFLRHPKDWLKFGKTEAVNDVRAALISEMEPDRQIQKLYRRLPTHNEYIRKYSDLADNLELTGINRRKYIINNTIKSINRTSRVLEGVTPIEKLDDYMFRVRSNRAWGDRQLSIPIPEGSELIHMSDGAYGNIFGLHWDSGYRGILDRTNQLKLTGSISDLSKPINIASKNISAPFKLHQTTTRVRTFLPKEIKNRIYELPNWLQESVLGKQNNLIHSNINSYYPPIKLDTFEAPYGTRLSGYSEKVVLQNGQQDLPWWEIAGFE